MRRPPNGPPSSTAVIVGPVSRSEARAFPTRIRCRAGALKRAASSAGICIRSGGDDADDPVKRGELEHASPWCHNPRGRQSSRALKVLHHVRRAHGDGLYCRRHWPVWTRSAAADGRHPGSAPTRSPRSAAVRRAGLPSFGSPGAGAPQGAEARRRRRRPPALRAPPGATPGVLTLRLGIAPQRGSYGRQPVSFEAACSWQLRAIARRSTVAGTTAWRSAAHRPVAAMSVRSRNRIARGRRL
jgi:hypothetical protein